MSNINDTTLLQDATIIKQETVEGANTHQRVGKLLEDIVKYVRDNETAWKTGGTPVDLSEYAKIKDIGKVVQDIISEDIDSITIEGLDQTAADARYVLKDEKPVGISNNNVTIDKDNGTGGNLVVEGTITGGALSTTGTITGNSLSTIGNAAVGGTLTTTGNTTLSSATTTNLTVTGSVTLPGSINIATKQAVTSDRIFTYIGNPNHSGVVFSTQDIRLIPQLSVSGTIPDADINAAKTIITNGWTLSNTVTSSEYSLALNPPTGITASSIQVSLAEATTSHAGLLSATDKTKLNNLTTSIPTATTSANGLMSSTDKTKLDNLSLSHSGATVQLVSGQTTIGSLALGINVANTTFQLLMGGTVVATAALPAGGEGGSSYSEATQSTSGLMSAGDKKILDSTYFRASKTGILSQDDLLRRLNTCVAQSLLAHQPVSLELLQSLDSSEYISGYIVHTLAWGGSNKVVFLLKGLIDFSNTTLVLPNRIATAKYKELLIEATLTGTSITITSIKNVLPSYSFDSTTSTLSINE